MSGGLCIIGDYLVSLPALSLMTLFRVCLETTKE